MIQYFNRYLIRKFLPGEAMKIGYSRVSAVSKEAKIHHDALEVFGCQRFYADLHVNDNGEQPELVRLLGHIKAGDILAVNQLDQLSESIRRLFKVIEIIEAKKAHLVSLEDNLDTTFPNGWESLKKSLRWSLNQTLPAGTAKIYLWLKNYGQVVVENCKTGIEELDTLTDEAVKITGCSPEEGYPGFDVASYLVDTFGGSIERVEYSPV